MRAGPGQGEVITDIVTAPAPGVSIFDGVAAFAFLSRFGAGLQTWTLFAGRATLRHWGGKEPEPIGVQAACRLTGDRHFARLPPIAALDPLRRNAATPTSGLADAASNSDDRAIRRASSVVAVITAEEAARRLKPLIRGADSSRQVAPANRPPEAETCRSAPTAHAGMRA